MELASFPHGDMKIRNLLDGCGSKFRKLTPHPADINIVIYPAGSVIILQDRADSLIKEYLVGHDAEVVCLCVSKSGSFCVSGQSGSQTQAGLPAKLIVWDIPRRSLVWEVFGLAGSVVSVDISCDSRFVVASGENLIVLVFDTKHGEIVYSRRFESVCQRCTFATTATGADEYAFMTVFDSHVCKNILKFDLNSMTYTVILSDKFSSLNRKPIDAVVIGDYFVLSSTSGDLCILSISQSSFCGIFSIGSESIGLLAVLSSTQLISVANTDKVILIELSHVPISLKILKQLFSPNSKITGLSCSCPDRTLLVSLADGSAISLKIDADDPPARLPLHRSPSRITVISTHASIPGSFITGTDTGEVSQYSTDTFSSTQSVAFSKAGQVTCLAVFDSKIFCGFSSGQIKILQDMRVIHELPAAHRGSVLCIDALNSFYATGGEDKVIRIWMRSNLLAQFSQSNGSIQGVLIDRSNEQVVCAYNDKREIFALNIKALKIVKKFSAIKFGNIVGMVQTQLNLDLVLVTAHFEGFVVVWDLDYDACLLSVKVDEFRLTCLSHGSTLNFVLCGNSAGGLCKVSLTDIEGHESQKSDLSQCLIVGISPNGSIIVDAMGNLIFVTV